MLWAKKISGQTNFGLSNFPGGNNFRARKKNVGKNKMLIIFFTGYRCIVCKKNCFAHNMRIKNYLHIPSSENLSDMSDMS